MALFQGQEQVRLTTKYEHLRLVVGGLQPSLISPYEISD